MSPRLPPAVTGIAGLRWLVVVLTVAGLGLLQGGHCTDEGLTTGFAMSAPHHNTHLSAASVTVEPSAERDGHAHTSHSPGTSAGACVDPMAAVTGTGPIVAAALRQVSAGPRRSLRAPAPLIARPAVRDGPGRLTVLRI